jgi:branched-chain amino acid transport system substrate-binding protein
MRRFTLRSWKTAAVLVVISAAAVAVLATGALASSNAKVVKVAIMTDCKGAFAFGYDVDIGGAQTAFAQFAHGVTKSHAKPSAGMSGIHVGATPIKIVGYGCGNDTVPVAVTETKRLMEKLNADVMIGPLSGDEAVYIANYAKAHPTKTFIIGTAGSQDPTMQIAPKNMFRYHGDGAQWNAGIGEIAYKKLGWRKAAIMMDDYSFGWTSGAGMIADFCAVGGDITKRVFPPLNTTDYAPFVRQLPPPNQVDGYFWVVGGTGTGAALKAYEQAYGKLDPKQNIGNLFFGFLGADKVVAPKVVGSYVGGFGNMPGVHNAKVDAYRAYAKKMYPAQNSDDGFFYNYYMAAKALTIGLARSGGAVGAKLQAGLPRSIVGPFQISNGGMVKLDSRRQAIQDQFQLQLFKNADGSVSPQVIAYVPGVDQSFGGLFTPSSPPPGRTQPPCKKLATPWQGKIRVVTNGKITSTILK